MGIVSAILGGEPTATNPLEQEAVPEKPSLISGLDPWLHPTKGWRKFARPRGTNKRRRLSDEARAMLDQ